MSDLKLDVDQAGELKAGFRRADWTNAEIKLLCEGDILAKVRQVICGRAEIVVRSILKFVSTVVVLARNTPFLAREKFVLDKSDTAPIKISWIGDNFRTWFLGKTEELPRLSDGQVPEQTLRYQKLRQDSPDASIIAELGGEEKAETTLSELYALMERQKNREDGPLLTDGKWNVFYIKDVNGVLRAVLVYWCDGGWYVRADSIGSPYGWSAGFQVFSRQP